MASEPCTVKAIRHCLFTENETNHTRLGGADEWIGLRQGWYQRLRCARNSKCRQPWQIWHKGIGALPPDAGARRDTEHPPAVD